jgi:glycerol uptake facilitator-like aquaporin
MHFTTSVRAGLRIAVAELVGTGALVLAVVGSGIAASRLSPSDVGLQLLENAIATALALAVLILVFAPVSGAHFNPVVTAVDAIGATRTRAGAGRAVLVMGAQIIGAIGGALLANVLFEVPAVLSTTERGGGGVWLGEVVATAGLVLVIGALVRTGRTVHAPWAVGAYIGAAYWFTSSTSFANPAVTIGRMFSDTFAGIAPVSVLPFLAAQVIGAAGGALLARLLFVQPAPSSTTMRADGLASHTRT